MAKLCECGCGQPTTLPTNRFLSGHNKARLTHGHAKKNRMSPEFNSWRAMIYRCSSSNGTDFADYAGRGISVCDRWRGKHGFENFLADMGERLAGMSLDRWPDVNGNYAPENCR